MESVAFHKLQVIHLEETAAAGLPASGMLCLKDLIFILALQGGSFLAGTQWYFILGSDISLSLRKSHQGMGNGLLQSSSIGLRRFVPLLLIQLRKARKSQFIDVNSFNPVSPK